SIETAHEAVYDMIIEVAHVIDAGKVVTEKLYFLVGDRELDGGLMCTASHNPKAYTGAKLLRRGALALSGDAGIGELRDIVTAGEPGEHKEGAGGYETADVTAGLQEKGKSLNETGGARQVQAGL